MNALLLFPQYEKKIHYSKDPGQLVYHLSQQGINTEISCFKNENDEFSGDGLKIITNQKYVHNKPSHILKIVNFIIKNGKNYDLLMVFHFSITTILFSMFFKKINPNGKVFLKLDGFKDVISLLYRNPLFNNSLYQYMLKKVMEPIDLMSCELYADYEFYKNILEIKNIIYLPNCIDNISSKFSNFEFSQKENIILNVSTHYSKPKNTGLLIDSFLKSKLYLKGWKLLLVGPSEKKINENLQKYGVEYIGPIYDREKLIELYKSSKIYMGTSYYESFGISLLEAGLFGNFILSTNVGAFEELTDHFKYGKCISYDSDKNGSILNEIASNSNEYFETNAKNHSKFLLTHFNYNNYISTLISKISVKK